MANQAGPVRPVPIATAQQRADERYDEGARRGGAWRIVFFLSLTVLVAALGTLAYIGFTYWNGQNQYNNLADENFEAPEQSPITLADFNVDWDALRAINPDIVGWIYLPDTIISYPIAWKKDDEQYYLYHDFNNRSVGTVGAEYGCIMLDGVNSPDWTDQVNVIYGHHMANGSMFALLADFIDNSDLFNEHRTFYVLTPEGNFRLTSFAVNKVLGSSTDIVIPNFNKKKEFREYVQARLNSNLVDPVSPPAPKSTEVEQVFALSTCSAPDDWYRIITFCTVDEFLPAGATEAQTNSLVDKKDIENVEAAIGERVG